MTKNRAVRFLSDKKDVLASVLLCLAALVTALCLHPAYEVNDDLIMEALLYGYKGAEGTSFLVFINRILGCILHFLVSVFPRVNWYFVMHYAVSLTSLFVLSRTLIRKFDLKGIFVSILIVASGMETLFIVQYTKTAALAVIAGAIGLFFSLREKGYKVFKGVCIALIVTGSMMRFESFLMVFPFAGCIGLYELIPVFKSRKEDIRRYLIVMGVTLCLAGACYAGGKIINSSTSGSDEFYKYNEYRTQLSDFPVDHTDDPSSEALMVANWMNNDPGVITPDRLEELGKAYSVDEKPFTPDALKAFIGGYIPSSLFTEPMILVSFVTALLYLAFSRRKIWIIPVLGCYVVLEWYLFSMGRAAIHRVDYGMLFALLATMTYLFDFSIPKASDFIRKVVGSGVLPVLAVTGAVIICNYSITWHYSNLNNYARMRTEWADAAGNPDYRYMVHPMAPVLDTERNIYDLPYGSFDDGYFYIGGWQEGIAIPGMERMPQHDIDGNPWEECVDSETIRLVFPERCGYQCMNTVSFYIGDKYGKNVTGVLEYQNESFQVFRVVSEG